jgi:hypothetical protein
MTPFLAPSTRYHIGPWRSLSDDERHGEMLEDFDWFGRWCLNSVSLVLIVRVIWRGEYFRFIGVIPFD